MSPELACVPFDQRRAEKQCGDCTETEKDSEWKQHLHVSLTLPGHQRDAYDEATQHADKDRKNRQTPTEISADHEHHLHVAKAHRLDSAQFLPRPAHEPERAAAKQRADECAGK